MAVVSALLSRPAAATVAEASLVLAAAAKDGYGFSSDILTGGGGSYCSFFSIGGGSEGWQRFQLCCLNRLQ